MVEAIHGIVEKVSVSAVAVSLVLCGKERRLGDPVVNRLVEIEGW